MGNSRMAVTMVTSAVVGEAPDDGDGRWLEVLGFPIFKE
jgi:hypothetical protein